MVHTARRQSWIKCCANIRQATLRGREQRAVRHDPQRRQQRQIFILRLHRCRSDATIGSSESQLWHSCPWEAGSAGARINSSHGKAGGERRHLASHDFGLLSVESQSKKRWKRWGYLPPLAGKAAISSTRTYYSRRRRLYRAAEGVYKFATWKRRIKIMRERFVSASRPPRPAVSPRTNIFLACLPCSHACFLFFFISC